MKLTDIRLQNFRSYTDSSFEIDPSVTIVVGPNAAGKTNLIEAVMLVCTNKTYRSSNTLINHEKEWARIDAHTSSSQQRTIKIQNVTGSTQNTLELDGKIYKRPPQNTLLPIVFFEPNHLFLLHGDPKNRRNYLDDLIEQTTPGYNKVRKDYQRSLSQRNRLLKVGVKDDSLLFAWNIKLAEDAAKIDKQRKEIINKIQKSLQKTYQNISSKDQNIEIKYKSKIESDNYSNALLQDLDRNKELDEIRGFTGSGPHRDDFIIIMDGSPAENVCSRGEIRTLLLSLKIIELKILEETKNQKPILLLDDVFSELDGARRKALVNFLDGHQTIITTTDADIVTKNFSQNCQIIVLSDKTII